MPVVQYKCDTCKREISVPQNIRGLDTFGRCNITQGCRGQLHFKKNFFGLTRGPLPAPKAGLDDHSPRNALYNHEQKIKSTVWEIRHNMNVFPTIETFIEVQKGNGEFVLERTDPEVTVISENQVNLTFDKEQRGFAQAIARSTKELRRIIEAPKTEVVQPFIQVSADEEVTIATTRLAEFIELEANFVITSGGDVITKQYVYTVDNVASINSPWSSIDAVALPGTFGQTKYDVRSFDLVTAAVTAAVGKIPSGSGFYISRIRDQGGSWTTLAKNEALIIYAKDPYEFTDRVNTKYIDLASGTAETVGQSFFVTNNNLHAYSTTIKSTFPPIQEAS